MELEGLTVQLADIWQHHQIEKVMLQHFELKVRLAVVIGQDRDAVVWLGSVGVGCVVNESHLTQLPVQNPQIFTVHAFRGLVAMLPEQPMVDVKVIGVEVVQNHIRIARVTGCEDDDLEVFAQILEDFLSIGSDVDACLDDLSSWEGDRQFNIVGWSQGIVAVNQSLIQIEDHTLLA